MLENNSIDDLEWLENYSKLETVVLLNIKLPLTQDLTKYSVRLYEKNNVEIKVENKNKYCDIKFF